MSDTSTKRYIVRSRGATVRAAPRDDGAVLWRIGHGRTFEGRVVAGEVSGRAAMWVERSAEDGGGYVLQALLDEVP